MDKIMSLGFLLLAHVFMLQNMLLFFLIFKHHVENTSEGTRQHITCPRRYSLISKITVVDDYLSYLTKLSDVTCVNNLRMNRNAFARLTYLLQHIGGLKSDKYVSVSEKVATFLSILAHHKKNRVVQTDFKRSGHTISRYFKQTLKAVMRISNLLLVKPEAINETESNDTWKPFQGCLGALDGTFIDVQVPIRDQLRYHNRKGDLSVNVLGVCNKDLNFIYVLTGWEGSAADSRVLRAALTKNDGLKVPAGNYYLCDCGYTNSDGFLDPYRGTRYHLTEWRGSANPPQNPHELFNLKHSRARNAIERSFGLLKKRWAVLRSPTFYSIKIQNLIILACALLHNFIRIEMDVDPAEEDLSDVEDEADTDEGDTINSIEPSQAWTNFRETLAQNMYNEWINT